MSYPIYQVDAFTSKLFGGNPAAVMPLENWLEDETLQALALENYLSETAYFVAEKDDPEVDFHIRWFTPGAEVPLCGHATLASAWIIFNKLGWEKDTVHFRSKSGILGVRQAEDGWLTLDFPRLDWQEQPTPELVKQALPDAPDTALYVPNDTNYLIVVESEQAVIDAKPDLRLLKQLGNQGLIVTARGEGCDFVSRYFAPGVGIEEDPVTGSIHSVLVPYWAEQLGGTTFNARQLSARGGELRCELKGDRVDISGQAAFYMEGQVYL